jgi:hypothetical protein
VRAVALLAACLVGWGAATASFQAAGADAGKSAVDLLGTWYVLVHFRDESTANPEADRWEDRIWVFARKGSRLLWTEYPIVIFADESGRFVDLSGGRRQRVLEAWEPNEAQLAEIRAGLEINARGAGSKTLRGSADRGYRSAGAMNQQSTSVIGYSETWSIEEPASLPVFGRRDSLGSGRTESMEGYTEYATTRVEQEGGLLAGGYRRDGARSGSFRMLRSGGISHAGDENERRKGP